jgi:restriction system protein
MLALSPSEFEAATATVFRGLGYQHVRVVGGAGDYCVDIEAVDPAGGSVVIQCKRYGPGNTVGSREVQTFLGMATIHHHAEHAILVTTSRFTANALNIERASGGRLELIDGERLAHMIQRAPEAAGAESTQPDVPTVPD